MTGYEEEKRQMSCDGNDYSESTYQVLEGTINEGSKYELIFISTIVLELVLDDDVQHFQLSSNDKNFLPFDDVVIEIKRNEKFEEKLAIQLKLGGRPLSTKNLTSKNGEFSIKSYFDRTKTLKQLENYQMIIFTNRKCDKIGDHFTLEDENFDIKMTPCNSKLFSEYYREKGVAYKFESLDKKVSEDYSRFLKSFRLYGNQLNVNQLERKLRQKFQQVFYCKKFVFTEYLNFITEWSKKKGIRKKLNKNWIKEVIALHLLLPLVHSVSFDSQYNKKTDIFRKCIDNFNITIFEYKYWERISKFWSIKKVFVEVDTQIVNTLKAKYHMNSDHIEKLDDLSQEEFSTVMWLLDKAPLIIKYDKCIIKAIHFFKRKKFIILFSDSLDDDFKDAFSNLKIFQNVTDLKENFSLYEELIKTLHCSLQGKERISLETLIGGDYKFEEQITTNDLLLFLSDDFMIGEGEILPDIYIERYFYRHIIDYKFLSEIDKNSVIMISNFNKTNRYFEKFHMIDVETLLKEDFIDEEFESRKIIYFCISTCSQEKFENICSQISGKSKYHHLRIFNEKLEWICSRGGIEDLKQFQSEENLMEEKELRVCNNNVAIICGDPGLGKTTSMKYLKTCTYPSFWTVLIYPKDHSKYFREKQQNMDTFDQYIFENIYQKVESFVFKVFKIFLKSGRVNFIWDGLDEVSDTNLSEVLNVIETLSNKGSKQWITSRNNIRNELESRFSTLATTIRQFNEEEQKYYITKRLPCSKEELESIFTKIQNSIGFFKYNEILSNPLQIFMFTELFNQDREKYSELLTNTFSLTDLYYHFILQKFNVFFKEKGNLHDINSSVSQIKEGYRKSRILSYQHVALQMYFCKEGINFIDYDACAQFLTEIREDKDSVGIITTISSDNVPNFLHNSYGEYFAALYLSKSFKNIPNLSQFLFKEKYKNIRFLFDLLLAKNCTAHTAVLCKNFEALKQCEKDALTSEDLGERNPLQLACSWGEMYPLLKVTEENDERYIVYEEEKNRIKKANLEHQNILRYLSEICNLENTDQVYKLNSYSYADETFSLSNLAVLAEKHIVPFRNLKNFRSIPVVLYYSAAFDFSSIFDHLKPIPRVYTQYGESLLSVAATSGSLASCEKLLNNHNANVNSTNKYEQSPLFKALRYGHLEIVELLVKNGAHVNTAAEGGWTPLHTASANGHIEIVELLVKNGAQVNAVGSAGWAPLHAASGNGHVAIVGVLIKNGALVNAVTEWGWSPLHTASGSGHVDIVELLVRNGGEINAVAGGGCTPLHTASGSGHVEIVKLLVESGAQVNAATEWGWTPLHSASQNGHVQVVELLVKYGAEVNAASPDGWTPLDAASEKGHVEIVQLLIKEGANVDN